MASTPAEKWKPINKSLLTPCRRPGLSRVVKTPLHIYQKQEFTEKISEVINSPKENVTLPNRNKQTKNLTAVLHSHELKPEIDSTNELKENTATPVRSSQKTSVKIKKSSNRLSMKRPASPEEQSDLDEHPTIVHNVETDDESKIEEIQKRIKEKEARLEDLKRAAAYAKINDVRELEKLTVTWKVGCNRALNHLLKKLQEHYQIEMPSLLKKLNIPESIVDCSDS